MVPGMRLSLFSEDVQHASRTNEVPLIAVLREIIRETKQLHVFSSLLLESLCLTVELHIGIVDQVFHGRLNSYHRLRKPPECFCELSNLMRTTPETSSPCENLDEVINNLGVYHPQHYITGYLRPYSKNT